MSKWIRKGDKVKVIAGNDKGKFGEVLSRTETRVIVKGINVRKKHQKPQEQGKQGQIIEMEMSIHISNVRLCVEGENTPKVKLQINSKSEKELVYKLNDKVKVYRNIKKPAKVNK